MPAASRAGVSLYMVSYVQKLQNCRNQKSKKYQSLVLLDTQKETGRGYRRRGKPKNAHFKPSLSGTVDYSLLGLTQQAGITATRRRHLQKCPPAATQAGKRSEHQMPTSATCNSLPASGVSLHRVKKAKVKERMNRSNTKHTKAKRHSKKHT